MRPDGGPRLPGVNAAVVLPFLGPTETVEIEIEASLRALDVHFSIDTTASFNDEISILQDDLSDEVVPELRRRVPDVSVGVSSFQDFPRTPFGTADDKPFELRTAITSNLRRVDTALAGLNRPIGNGGDGPESGAEALYQVATGLGYRHNSGWVIRPYNGEALEGGGTGGGVGFREGALRTVVHITDATTHTPEDYASVFPDTRSLEAAGEALAAIDVRALGIVSHAIARDNLEALAFMTGATTPADANGCATGIDGDRRPAVDGVCPLVFDVREDGRGLSDTLIDGLVALVNAVDLRRVHAELDNDPLRFVTLIEALDADVERGVPQPELRDERPADGTADTFANVRPGSKLRFLVHMQNTLLVPDDAPQFYTVSVQLIGDGLSLGTQTIRVEIPARLPPDATDAGSDAATQDDASGM